MASNASNASNATQTETSNPDWHAWFGLVGAAAMRERLFFCGGGKDIFAHLAHPPTGWIEDCKDSWQRICTVRSEPRSNLKELVFPVEMMRLVEILGKFFFNLFPVKTYIVIPSYIVIIFS